MINPILNSVGAGATIEESEINYESLYTTSNISASLGAINGAKSNGATALSLATNKALFKPASDTANMFEIQNSAGTNILTVNTTNSRIGINTDTLNSALNIGGDRKISFIGTGIVETSSGSSLSLNASGANVTSNANQWRLTNDVAGYRLNIIDSTQGGIAIRCNSTNIGVSVRDSNNVEQIALTTGGFRQVPAGAGITNYQFDADNSSNGVNGDGTGLVLRNDSASNVQVDLGRVEAVWDAVSPQEASLRLSARDTSTTTQEVLRLEGVNQIVDFRKSGTALGTTLATIGNVPSGGTASQNEWITVKVAGNTRYIPVWA